MIPRRITLIAAIVVLGLPFTLSAQNPGYPVKPTILPDAEEIALAVSAAPPDISDRATVFTIKGGKPERIRQGTNGVSCMVARDLHEGSAYPICFDAEGSKTRLRRELMEVGLRMAGRSEAEVKTAVAAAYASGELRMPAAMSVAYMLSPRQVIFSSPDADGVRVGAWWPHLMIMGPGLTAANLGIAPDAKISMFSVGAVDAHHNELVVKVLSWSDGTPVKK